MCAAIFKWIPKIVFQCNENFLNCLKKIKNFEICFVFVWTFWWKRRKILNNLEPICQTFQCQSADTRGAAPFCQLTILSWLNSTQPWSFKTVDFPILVWYEYKFRSVHTAAYECSLFWTCWHMFQKLELPDIYFCASRKILFKTSCYVDSWHDDSLKL